MINNFCHYDEKLCHCLENEFDKGLQVVIYKSLRL